MGRANNSSVDTTKGDRLAKKMNEKRNNKTIFNTTGSIRLTRNF